jgi:small subunit ribosomal protein S1
VLPNPWDTVEARYHQGDMIPVRITRVVDFGAFAEIEPGIEGLVHISELADITVAEPLKTVRPGDEVMAKILRVDPRRQRVGLSIRQAADAGAFIEEDEEIAESAADASTEDLDAGEAVADVDFSAEEAADGEAEAESPDDGSGADELEEQA